MIAIAAIAATTASASSAPANITARDIRCAARRSSERDRPMKNAGGAGLGCGARDEPVVGAAVGPRRISLGKGSTAIRFSPELEFVAQCNGSTLSPRPRDDEHTDTTT